LMKRRATFHSRSSFVNERDCLFNSNGKEITLHPIRPELDTQIHDTNYF
jgi:hypothetical protein